MTLNPNLSAASTSKPAHIPPPSSSSSSSASTSVSTQKTDRYVQESNNLFTDSSVSAPLEGDRVTHVTSSILEQMTPEARELYLSRIEVAINDPKMLASNLFCLFTAQEINRDRALFDVILEKALLVCDPKEKSYLQKHILYLDRLKEGKTFSRDGHHWDCLGLDPKTGCWSFKLNWKYDLTAEGASRDAHPIEHDNIKIFPAVEPTLAELNLPDLNHEYLPLLGFQCEFGISGVYLTLPDPKTLKVKWETFRIEHPHLSLPDFTFTEVDGITSSATFINLLNENDVIISTDSAFIHDTRAHVFTTIIAILRDPVGYPETRADMRKCGTESLAILDRARQQQPAAITAETAAGIAVIEEMTAIFYDLVTSMLHNTDRRHTIAQWQNGSYFEYFWDVGLGLGLVKNQEMHAPLRQLGMNISEDFVMSFEACMDLTFPTEKIIEIRKQIS